MMIYLHTPLCSNHNDDTRGGSDFAKPGKLLKILEFTIFYPHVTFKISPEGNRRKEIKNEISVKVFLDVDTVNILDKYDLGEYI